MTLPGPPWKLPIVGVMGSGVEAHEERSQALGFGLATLGVHLLTGGGGGVMEAVSRAFCGVPDRDGCVLGILPSASPDTPGVPKPGYPNPWVEIPIYTHLPLSGQRGLDPQSRNHVNVLSSNVLIALPGGEGTASEVALAVRYEVPVIAFLERLSELPGLQAGVPVESSVSAVLGFVEAALEGLP
ncbi:molybdenum cofactor carrier protein [Myxococcota bacterium]|nr:molybdenum cofactor carrier protein [Myxococcota bacterium]